MLNFTDYQAKNKTVATKPTDVERTLVFIKPDAVQRKLIGKVISRFEEKGFNLLALKMLKITPKMADYHYDEHLQKPFYPGLKAFITSGPVVAMVLEGRNAVEVVRKLVGATDAAKAEPGTIRGDFSLSGSQNIVHASDSPASAKREIAHFFPVLKA